MRLSMLRSNCCLPHSLYKLSLVIYPQLIVSVTLASNTNHRAIHDESLRSLAREAGAFEEWRDDHFVVIPSTPETIPLDGILDSLNKNFKFPNELKGEIVSAILGTQ